MFGNANSASTTVAVTGDDATIRANFAHNKYTVTVTNDGNGSTSPSGAVTVNSGTSRSITATPNSGYHFVNWTQTAGTGTAVFGDADSANTTVTVTGSDATIRANFIPYYTLTVTSDGNGSTNLSGAIIVNNGSSTVISATPNTDYLFANWTKITGTGTVVFGDANSADTTVTVTGGYALIRANFAMPLNKWIAGSINAGESQWYCLKTTPGTKYDIYWDDSYSGSDTYSCDIKVSAYYKNLSTTYFTEVDSAYNTPRTITATEDYVFINVQGYFSDETGTFAIKVSPHS